MYEEIKKLLGPEGPLAKNFKNYEPRSGQLSMALEAARAFKEDDFSLIEAGTGTGKTLAYLLPALLSGKKTVVSTGLKNLQDQIFEKDLPFIRKFFGDNFRAARLKGRENYLCLYYLKKALAQPTFFKEDAPVLREVAAWAKKTASGDRAELPSMEEGGGLWAEISAPSERCLGQKCPDFSDCFLWKARKEAAAADLVLVNHHLFMADLAVRASGFGEVLPEWEAVVFDEAHLLEDAATSYFGRTLSSGGLLVLKRELEKALMVGGPVLAAFKDLITVFGRQAEALPVAFYKSPGERELWAENDPESGQLRDFLLNLHHDALALAGHLKKPGQDDEILNALAQKLNEAAHTALFIAEGNDREYVYQAERQGRRLNLSAFPIRVSRQLSEHLIHSGRTLIFTSATLSSGGDFSFFKNRLGIWPEVEGLSIASPFDYKNRTLLYLPRHLPQPSAPGFPDAAAAEMEILINLSRGRALALFTSHKNMQYVAAKLKGRLQWPVMVQGEQSRSRLLQAFTAETSSVLFATHSFWQGVDVPGESLSAVIIEKLPFPRPDRPLVRARSQLLESEGHDSFMNYFVPEAALTLKQGLGRLMRSASDQGLLAVLDVRVTQKGYGKRLMKAIPPSTVTGDLAAVAEFMAKI